MEKTKIALAIDPHMLERNPRCRKDNYLETVLGKLEYLAENNNYVIIAGDLFHIHSNSTLFFNRVYTLFKKYRGKFHAIPGNHDVFHRNLSALDKTTLGSLYFTDVLELHLEPWYLSGIKFVPVLVNDDPDKIAIDEENTSVLIAHKFYDNNFDPKESLFPDDIRRLKYNMVFLGHDHKPYEEEFVGDSMIIRMGSLTRMDTQCYNRDREIAYYQLSTAGDGKFEWERKVVPSKPITDIYTEEAINHMSSSGEKKELVSFVQIGDALAKLTKSSGGIHSLDKTLLRLKCPQTCRDDIKWRHEINHISYT